MFISLSRRTVVYGGSDVIFKLAQFALLPLYTANLSVEQFGIMALLQVGALLIGTLANLGVNYSVQRYYFERPAGHERTTLVSTGLAELLLSNSLLAGLGIGLAYFARDSIQQEYHIGWSLIVLALVTIVPDQIGQYALDTSRWQFAAAKFFILSLAKNLVGLLLGAWLLIHQQLGLMGLFAGNLVGACVAAPLGAWLVRRDLSFNIDLAVARELLLFGVPFMFSALAFWAFGSLDRWLLARFSDNVQVGLFSIAFKVASLISLAISAFQQAWMPTAMRMAHEDPHHRTVLARVITVWVFFLALFGFALSLFAQDVLRLFTPRPYWPAAPIIGLAATAVVLSGMSQVAFLGIALAKRTKLIGVAAWIAAAINVSVNLVLIPRYGAFGAAIATIVSYGVLNLIYAYCSQRMYPLPLNGRAILLSLCIVAAATAVAFHPIGKPLDPAYITLKILTIIGVFICAVPKRGAIFNSLGYIVRSRAREDHRQPTSGRITPAARPDTEI